MGGQGDGTIIGGEGIDVVTGGSGDDTFVYNEGDGADTITAFNAGNTGSIDDRDQSNNDFVDLSAFYTSDAEEAIEALGSDTFVNEIDMLHQEAATEGSTVPSTGTTIRTRSAKLISRSRMEALRSLKQTSRCSI